MGEPQRDAQPGAGTLRDELLERLGRLGVRQLPRLGGAVLPGGGLRRLARLGAGRALARDAGGRVRLRGILDARPGHLERGISRLVASDKCADASGTDSLPGKCRDVALAEGVVRETCLGAATVNENLV